MSNIYDGERAFCTEVIDFFFLSRAYSRIAWSLRFAVGVWYIHGYTPHIACNASISIFILDPCLFAIYTL
jgi:hypothetical protein